MRKKVDECEFLIQKAQKKTLSVDDVSRQLSMVDTKVRTVEGKLMDHSHANEEAFDEMRQKVNHGETDRKYLGSRFDQLMTEFKKHKEEIATIKDSVRRQIEESHVQLKMTFTDFSSQIDSFQAQVASNQAQAEVLRSEIRSAFAKMDFN